MTEKVKDCKLDLGGWRSCANRGLRLPWMDVPQRRNEGGLGCAQESGTVVGSLASVVTDARKMAVCKREECPLVLGEGGREEVGPTREKEQPLEREWEGVVILQEEPAMEGASEEGRKTG